MVAPTATCWRVIKYVATVFVMRVALVKADVVRQTACINAVSGVGVKRKNYRNTPCREMSEVLMTTLVVRIITTEL
jgi:hypothetical protein